MGRVKALKNSNGTIRLAHPNLRAWNCAKRKRYMRVASKREAQTTIRDALTA